MAGMAILERVRLIVARELYVDPDEVTPEAKLRGEKLKADSLDLVNLTMALAVEFGVEMIDKELQKIVTVSDVVDYLESCLNGTFTRPVENSSSFSSTDGGGTS
jgi:acyl carrier protein